MIFVTGGTGLVGAHLLRHLVHTQHEPIRALRRTTSNMELVHDIIHQIEWVEGDLLDTDALFEYLEDVKQIYHCAAVVSFIPAEADWMTKVNVEGTANVVNMALERQVEKLVYVSSIAAIGRSLTKPNVHEAIKWEDSNENSKYAISKHLAEREVWRAYFEGLPTVIVNPSIILGAGDWSKGSSRLIQNVADGLRFYPKGGSGFVDVLDVCEIMVQLMESDIVGERFILNAENLPYQTFFNLVADHLQKKRPQYAAPRFLAAIAWRLEAIRAFIFRTRPIITRETARTASSRYLYQNNKIKIALNWQFRPIEATIKRTCESFLNQSTK